MRHFVLPVAFLALGAAACGAITGLGGYGDGPPDASVSVGPQGGSSGGQRDDGAAASGDDTTEITSNDDASDAVAIEETSDDGPTSEDGGESDDGGEPSDASSTMPDSGSIEDAGTGAHDAAAEAAPVCSTSNCKGCCSEGQCVGGMSTGTCGSVEKRARLAPGRPQRAPPAALAWRCRWRRARPRPASCRRVPSRASRFINRAAASPMGRADARSPSATTVSDRRAHVPVFSGMI